MKEKLQAFMSYEFRCSACSSSRHPSIVKIRDAYNSYIRRMNAENCPICKKKVILGLQFTFSTSRYKLLRFSRNWRQSYFERRKNWKWCFHSTKY